MTPKEVLEALVEGLQQSSAFSGGGYASEQLDLEGINNRLAQPIVVLQPIASVRAEQWNTDLVGFATDDQDRQIGRIYEAIFDADVQIDIWVAAGDDQLDATDLGGDLKRALYRYDSQMVGDPFPDGKGGTVDDIEDFRVGDGRRQDDLSGPGVRRWRQDVSVEFVERINTAQEYGEEDYVATVDIPSDGDLIGGTTASVSIEYQPS